MQPRYLRFFFKGKENYLDNQARQLYIHIYIFVFFFLGFLLLFFFLNLRTYLWIRLLQYGDEISLPDFQLNTNLRFLTFQKCGRGYLDLHTLPHFEGILSLSRDGSGSHPPHPVLLTCPRSLSGEYKKIAPSEKLFSICINVYINQSTYFFILYFLFFCTGTFV